MFNKKFGGLIYMMKRIVIIETDNEELLNRFANRIDKLLEEQVYDNEIQLSHFKED